MADHIVERRERASVPRLGIAWVVVLVVATFGLSACPDDENGPNSESDAGMKLDATVVTWEEASAGAQSDFADFLKTRNQCAVAADCALVQTECPLGCYQFVNRKYVGEVREKAKALIREIEESAGTNCAYNCSPVTRVECVAEKCDGTRDEADGGDAP